MRWKLVIIPHFQFQHIHMSIMQGQIKGLIPFGIEGL